MTPLEAAEKRIQSLEKQVRDCELGIQSTIICPYCGEINNQEQERVCCAKFAAAVEAILQRKDSGDLIRRAARIAEGAMKGHIN